MKKFAVHTVELNCDYDRAFDYISRPENLPEWTNAFQSATKDRATLKTPTGSFAVQLSVNSSRDEGTIDWLMKFPDNSVSTAYSRIVSLDPNCQLYSFVLTAPPLPLEQLEGMLDQQSNILKEELQCLRGILEHK